MIDEFNPELRGQTSCSQSENRIQSNCWTLEASFYGRVYLLWVGLMFYARDSRPNVMFYRHLRRLSVSKEPLKAAAVGSTPPTSASCPSGSSVCFWLRRRPDKPVKLLAASSPRRRSQLLVNWTEEEESRCRTDKWIHELQFKVQLSVAEAVFTSQRRPSAS